MLKALAVVAAGVLAGALFVVLRPEGDDDGSGARQTTTAEGASPNATTAGSPPAAPQLTRINIEVRDGEPAGGVARLSVDRDRPIDLVVSADVADEVHVHRYDISRDVAPGQPAHIRFEATIPGRIEVELEERHMPLLELTVNP